jgi:integrase
LFLFDPGARAKELLDINLDEINQITGDILIRSGKRRKPRTVFIGKQTRKSLRKYLIERSDNSPALWITKPTHGSQRLS